MVARNKVVRTKDLKYEKKGYWTIKVVNALFDNNAGKHERVGFREQVAS